MDENKFRYVTVPVCIGRLAINGVLDPCDWWIGIRWNGRRREGSRTSYEVRIGLLPGISYIVNWKTSE
jgi:hypothetical protein